MIVRTGMHREWREFLVRCASSEALPGLTDYVMSLAAHMEAAAYDPDDGLDIARAWDAYREYIREYGVPPVGAIDALHTYWRWGGQFYQRWSEDVRATKVEQGRRNNEFLRAEAAFEHQLARVRLDRQIEAARAAALHSSDAAMPATQGGR